MMARLMTLLGGTSPEPADARDAYLDDQWQSLLAAASSPAERDEINDVFGRAAA